MDFWTPNFKATVVSSFGVHLLWKFTKWLKHVKKMLCAALWNSCMHFLRLCRTKSCATFFGPPDTWSLKVKFWMCKPGHQHFYFHYLDALSKRLQWCFSLNSESAKNNLGYLINKAANDSPIINSRTLSVTLEFYVYRTWCYWLCNENVFFFVPRVVSSCSL